MSAMCLIEWTTEHGKIAIQYPWVLSAQEIDDAEQMLALAIRVMRRRATEQKDHPHAAA